MLSFESSPIPTFCVTNRATENTFHLRHTPISEGGQLKSNENCLKRKSEESVIQPSITEEMALDQSLVDYLVSENADNLDINYVDIKTSCSNTLSSGGIISEHSPLNDSPMKDFKIVHQEQKQSSSMLSGVMSSNVDINAMHDTRTSKINCIDIKTEYSDELVPRLLEKVVDDLDLKTEYSDELVPEHSEQVVGHWDIHTEYSDELVPGQSERVVGHLDRVSYGDESCHKMEDSIMTDCDADYAFIVEQEGSFACSICLRIYTSCLDVKRHILEQHTKPICALAQGETAFCQHLSTCEESNTSYLQPTLRPNVDHHGGDVFNDVKPSIAELPLSNAELWQQEDLSSFPSVSTAELSTKSNVNAGANADHMILFESSPIPTFCVINRATENTFHLHHTPISEGGQVKSNENCLKRKLESVIQPSKTEEMALDQSLVGYDMVSENADDLDTDYVNIKPSCKNTLSSGGLISENCPLGDSPMKDFKILHQEQKQSSSMLSGAMSSNVDMNAMHDTRTSKINCTDIKTEYSDKLVPVLLEKVVDDLDIKTEYSDELVMGQSERVVGHLDIKTEHSDEPVPGQSERVVGHLDSFGDESCHEMKDSIMTMTDCDADDTFIIEQEGYLSTCEEPELDDKVSYGNSYPKSEGISIPHHRTQSRQTEGRKDDDAQTMSVKDVYACPLCKLAFSSHQYLESHSKRRHIEQHWRNVTHSILEKRSAVGLNGCEDEERTFLKSINANEKRDIDAFEQVNGYVLKNKLSMMSRGEGSFKCNECDKMFSTSSDLQIHIRTHTGEKPYQCNECDKRFSHIESLNIHIRTHTGEKPYQCNECDRRFSSSGGIRIHIRTHTGERPFKCNECGKRFRTSSNLLSHIRIHTQETPLKCNECGKRFRRSSNLLSHMRTHTEEKPFKCNECSKAYTRKIHLYHHMRTHTEEKPFKCNECSKAYAHKIHLYHHMRTHTEEKPFKCNGYEKMFSMSGTGSLHSHVRTHTEEKSFKCNECGETFSLSSNLHRHVKTHTGEKPFQCNECGKKFSRRSGLNKHIRKHTGEKPFQCNECGKMFLTSGSLDSHIRTHTGEKPFQCNECDKMFCTSGSLHSHKRTHTGEQTFKCNECGKTFSRRDNLRSHIRTHTGEKPFKCNECDKMFSTSVGLHSHVRTHTGEKPFKCNECDRMFSTCHDLQVHTRTHTGEKPFKCNECGKTFSLISNLNSHIRTHTGEKPFHCNECDRMFSSNGGLRIHIRTHTGEKPFKCNECGKTFSQRGNLQSHIKTHTGEKPFKCNECGKAYVQRSHLLYHMRMHTEAISM